jgi:2-phospho-L-lactate/phosphoenolpyruvate guanylyltransferase
VGGASWSVVVPVKRLDAAKSRLRGALEKVPHETLALSLARDTVSAVLACTLVRQVLVVTSDRTAGAALRALGALVVPEPPCPGLNPAFAHGASLVDDGWVAALTADLPALRSDELAAALSVAAETPVRRFVADASGTGTVLLTSPPGVPLDPRFGTDSAAAHAASGAAPLVGDWPTLRRDVDAPADLHAAAALGLGQHTAALLAGALRPLPDRRPAMGTRPRQRGHSRNRIANAEYGAGMQGTVATYDPGTRSGTLLLDDGTELAFPAAAFDASGLRLLRTGQRVRIERDSAGQIVRVTLPTFD